MAKKPNLSLPKKPHSEVLVPVMCGCTWKPYPHIHKKDHPINEWNWEETQSIWAKEKESKKQKFKVSAKIIAS